MKARFHGRRRGAAIAIALFSAATMSNVVSAQTPPTVDTTPSIAVASLPEVSITATDGTLGSIEDCKGDLITDIAYDGVITLSRSGDTSEPLTINLAYAGDAWLTDGMPETIDFEVGESTFDLEVSGAPEAAGPTVDATITASETYTVVDPSTVTVAFPSTDEVDTFCDAIEQSTKIEVGEVPEDLDLVDLTEDWYFTPAMELTDALAPGLSADDEGVFSGAATAAGTYTTHGYICEGDAEFGSECVYELTLNIEVVEGAKVVTTPAPAAPAATPVKASPKYTG